MTFAERQALARKQREESQQRNREEMEHAAAAKASIATARSILAGFAISDGGTVRPVNESDVTNLGAWVHGGGAGARIIVLPSAAERMSPADFAGRGSLYSSVATGDARQVVVLDFDGSAEVLDGAEVHELSAIVQRYQRNASMTRGEAPVPEERTLEQRADYLCSRLQHCGLAPEALKQVRDAVLMGDLRFLEELRVTRHALADPTLPLVQVPGGKAVPAMRTAYELSRWPMKPTLGPGAQTLTVARLLELADSRLEFEAEHSTDPTLMEAFPAKELI